MSFSLDKLASDSMAFLPELLLCGGIVLMLLLRLLKGFDRAHLGGLAMLLCLLAAALSIVQWRGDTLPGPTDSAGKPSATSCFGGLLVYDHFTVFVRIFLYSFAALIIWLTRLTGIPDREDSADFYCLLLGATVGMALMASANHLLMIWIAIEMASLPSYALAGFLKGRRQSSEAALKYVVYGGGAAGVMLYGISLLAGKFGTAYLPDLAVQFARALPAGGPEGLDPVLVIGALFILVGIAFKLAAVPFHFWCPDVFEGASAEVAGFLSVSSKGAALALLGRVSMTLSGLDEMVKVSQSGQTFVPAGTAWLLVIRFLVPTLACGAALTATFGNLAAYSQTNLKRLLAYSTIAHAGYMMMGLAVLTREGAGAVMFYLLGYLFMNLGAFAVVAFLRNQTGSEDLSDFRGLVRRSPWMVITLSFFLLSLLGIPPLIGFFGKFFVFAAVFHAGQGYSGAGESGLSVICYALLGVGLLNTLLSVFYYINVLRVMILENRAEDLEGLEPKEMPEKAPATLYAGVLALATLGLGIAFGPLLTGGNYAAKRFRDQFRDQPVPAWQAIPPVDQVGQARMAPEEE
jgi:NADH-quinone oxidoreductase subunit N